jgi:hypothetical protein
MSYGYGKKFNGCENKMKKQIVIGIALLSVVMFFCGCVDMGDSGPSGSTAIVMSDDFIKSRLKYPSSWEHDTWGSSHEECGENCWIVYGKGKAQNAFGTKIGITYKVKMKYISGDVYDTSSWDADVYYVNEE